MSRQNLLTIHELYTSWTGEFDFACSKGCSTCCTQSVSMTMLEGELIHEYIRSVKPELTNIVDNLPESSFNQKTTNQFAAACLRKEGLANDFENWDMDPCVFLHDNCCTIYPVRPFMCRSLGSCSPCHKTGAAEMDPLFLTLNTVIMQCIEHLDRGRPWGNMLTILKMSGGTPPPNSTGNDAGFRISEPIPGFLIPPDEADWIQERLQALHKIISNS